jgi:hypothetical protein
MQEELQELHVYLSLLVSLDQLAPLELLVEHWLALLG